MRALASISVTWSGSPPPCGEGLGVGGASSREHDRHHEPRESRSRPQIDPRARTRSQRHQLGRIREMAMPDRIQRAGRHQIDGLLPLPLAGYRRWQAGRRPGATPQRPRRTPPGRGSAQFPRPACSCARLTAIRAIGAGVVSRETTHRSIVIPGAAQPRPGTQPQLLSCLLPRPLPQVRQQQQQRGRGHPLHAAGLCEGGRPQRRQLLPNLGRQPHDLLVG